MHYLSSVYVVNQPQRVSGIFVAHHQEVNCKCVYIYIYIYTHTHTHTHTHNKYQLLYIYSIPPDDVLQICPKHVEVG